MYCRRGKYGGCCRDRPSYTCRIALWPEGRRGSSSAVPDFFVRNFSCCGHPCPRFCNAGSNHPCPLLSKGVELSPHPNPPLRTGEGDLSVILKRSLPKVEMTVRAGAIEPVPIPCSVYDYHPPTPFEGGLGSSSVGGGYRTIPSPWVERLCEFFRC